MMKLPKRHRMKKLTLREKQIELVARFLMNEYGLNDWQLQFRYMTKTLGSCFIRSKIIKLSTYYIEVKPYKRMINTILHEISHALTPFQGHNAVWKQKAIELGAIPKARLSDKSFAEYELKGE